MTGAAAFASQADALEQEQKKTKIVILGTGWGATSFLNALKLKKSKRPPLPGLDNSCSGQCLSVASSCFAVSNIGPHFLECQQGTKYVLLAQIPYMMYRSCHRAIISFSGRQLSLQRAVSHQAICNSGAHSCQQSSGVVNYIISIRTCTF